MRGTTPRTTTPDNQKTNMNKKNIYRWTAKAADWSTHKASYELAKTERGALIAAHRWCDNNLLHGMGADHVAIVECKIDDGDMSGPWQEVRAQRRSACGGRWIEIL